MNQRRLLSHNPISEYAEIAADAGLHLEEGGTIRFPMTDETNAETLISWFFTCLARLMAFEANPTEIDLGTAASDDIFVRSAKFV